MRILHIVNWFPSKPTPLSALWIKNHIRALSGYAINIIFHLEIKRGKFKIERGKNDDKSSYCIIYFPILYWKIIEVLSLISVVLVLFKKRSQEYDIINFHIAYPNCTYIHLIKKLINKPMVISEHWSAYHFHFNITKLYKRRRIQKIFQQNLPVVAVSKSLLEDIERFSNSSVRGYILPNAVNTDVFRYYGNISKPAYDIFFTVSQWKWPKDPFMILKAWQTIQNENFNLKLIIGGYGPQWEDMKKTAKVLNIEETIEFRGIMDHNQIAYEMNRATAFILVSEYETFSVACAEALCCGTPVIASRVGGLKEIINDQNGILIDNNVSAVIKAIKYMTENSSLYKKKDIFTAATGAYNEKNIGSRYYDIIQEIIRQ